jgi:NADPH:quinone reductase-like Zn-dependent oxidoreductase
VITIEISRPGDPDVLVATERPVPAPRPGELLIEVAAAGVNRPLGRTSALNRGRPSGTKKVAAVVELGT